MINILQVFKLLLKQSRYFFLTTNTFPLQKLYEADIYISTFHIEAKELEQGHTPSKRQSLHLNSGNLASGI